VSTTYYPIASALSYNQISDRNSLTTAYKHPGNHSQSHSNPIATPWQPPTLIHQQDRLRQSHIETKYEHPGNHSQASNSDMKCPGNHPQSHSNSLVNTHTPITITTKQLVYHILPHSKYIVIQSNIRWK